MILSCFMLPNSGIGYEKWMLIFVIGEPTDTAVMSQGNHSEPLFRAHHHSLQLRWAAPDCIHTPLKSHPVHQCSLCLPMVTLPSFLSWTNGMPCSSPSLGPH